MVWIGGLTSPRPGNSAAIQSHWVSVLETFSLWTWPLISHQKHRIALVGRMWTREEPLCWEGRTIARTRRRQEHYLWSILRYKEARNKILGLVRWRWRCFLQAAAQIYTARDPLATQLSMKLSFCSTADLSYVNKFNCCTGARISFNVMNNVVMVITLLTVNICKSHRRACPFKKFATDNFYSGQVNSFCTCVKMFFCNV